MIARLLALTAIKRRLSYWRSPPQVQTELLALTATSVDFSNQREEEEKSSSFAVFGGNMNSPYFYYVDGDYIEYLKERETQARGFTCVPNVHYWSTDKFVFGAVLEINDIPYFVPISSYSRSQQDLILMKDKNDGHILGSLRFNYMIPVPDHLLYKLDINALPTVNNRIHTSKELAFCRRNRDRIYRIALKTYNRVISKKDITLLKNSCDFAILEQAYFDYKCQHK